MAAPPVNCGGELGTTGTVPLPVGVGATVGAVADGARVGVTACEGIAVVSAALYEAKIEVAWASFVAVKEMVVEK